MSDPLTFLVVDDHTDNRHLLVKTLMRKFPGAARTECEDSDTAAALLGRQAVTAVVAHRTSDMDARPLIEKLRPLTTAPLVLVSGMDRKEDSRKVGADGFLHYDEWSKTGSLVAGLVER